MPNAALLCHAREDDLLVLRALGRIGQQKRPVHAGARAAHRIDILEVALDELHVREPIRVRFPRITCERTNLYAAGRQSLDDLATDRPGRPANQNHCCFSSSRTLADFGSLKIFCAAFRAVGVTSVIGDACGVFGRHHHELKPTSLKVEKMTGWKSGRP